MDGMGFAVQIGTFQTPQRQTTYDAMSLLEWRDGMVRGHFRHHHPIIILDDTSRLLVPYRLFRALEVPYTQELQ